jgi:hypothetical protein
MLKKLYKENNVRLIEFTGVEQKLKLGKNKRKSK